MRITDRGWGVLGGLTAFVLICFISNAFWQLIVVLSQL